MRSAVVRQFGAPLVIEDRPIPEPAPGQVVIRMEATGRSSQPRRSCPVMVRARTGERDGAAVSRG